MTKKGSKVKLSRRLGVPLTPKAARIMEKRQRGPGQRGGPRARRARASDYKLRLLEKQKLRAQYNIGERQLANYFGKARGRAQSGEVTTGEALVQSLERRLDALVHRGGLATTIYAARQLVSHGHIQINGRRVDIPSYTVAVGDTISVRPESRELPNVVEAVDSWQPIPYLEQNKGDRSVRLVRVPTREEVPVICEVPLVVEYYSR